MKEGTLACAVQKGGPRAISATSTMNLRGWQQHSRPCLIRARTRVVQKRQHLEYPRVHLARADPLKGYPRRTLGSLSTSGRVKSGLGSPQLPDLPARPALGVLALLGSSRNGEKRRRLEIGPPMNLPEWQDVHLLYCSGSWQRRWLRCRRLRLCFAGGAGRH